MNRRIGIFIGILLLCVLAIGLLIWLRSSEAPPATAPTPPPEEAARTQGSGSLPGQMGSGRRASGSWWEVEFTAPIYPDDPQRHKGGLDARLVDLMNRAERSLDIAIYDFDLANVAQAMAQAAGRGIRVRVVTDTDTLRNRDKAIQKAWQILREANIRIVDDNRPSIMHHKFTVVDGELVATGSWNYTDGDTYRLNNHLLILRSKEIAASYTAEFEQMFVQRRFSGSKSQRNPYPVITIGRSRVETYFAPQDRPASRIIDLIKNAQREVHFLAFSFTHDEIGRALLERHQAGVRVVGVFETVGSNTPFSEFNRLKEAGVEVYQDGNPWSMHHKVFIIDSHIVVTGSFNFSQNANRDNDENMLVIDDPALAVVFEQEFQFILDRAKQGRPP